MIKLFVADVDGTLLNERSELEEATIKAIKRFQKQGGIFMVATGRNHWELEDIVSRIDNVAINCANGAILFDEEGQLISSDFIDPNYADLIEEYCNERDTIVEYHGENYTYTCRDKKSFKQRAIANFARGHEDPEHIFDVIYEDEHMLFGVDHDDLPKNRISKLEVLFMAEEVAEGLWEKVKSSFQDCNIVRVEMMASIEITSAKADKGQAISDYCRIKGIKEDEVAVAGDSGNDISMLKRFKHSYAMGNADEVTKKAASQVASSNREEGIAKLINMICDENEDQ
ncbi:MAG: Cof-type HAD-IIB family hydrolase [Erysipelotrichaceae bacterium]|nr:Cof-type HAD-IIB family hydrolase [Erysipelotrichaceae bacterium]